jgi:GNAT superfamily N-acetyltransferase
MTRVRRALPTDRETVLVTTLRAFAADPLFRWVWPEDERYARCAREFLGLLLDLRTEGGEVWVVDDGAAAASWNPPGGLLGPPSDESARWAAVNDGFSAPERSRWSAADAAAAVPGDAGPHWYLGVLATDPDRRRRGLARLATGPVLAAADRTGLPAYLETAAPENLAFYATLGFHPVVETDLPDDGPRLWMLRRDPAPT